MAEKDSKFTPRDIEMMTFVLQCTTQGVPTAAQLDIPRLASMAGLTEGSAKTIWGNLRKKIMTSQDEATGAPTTPGESKPKKATSSAASKRKSTGGKKSENGEDIENGEEETPSKKPRGRPAKKAKASDGEGNGETIELKDAADAPVKPKKKVASKKSPKTPKTPTSPLTTSDKTTHDEDDECITVDTGKNVTVGIVAKNGNMEVPVSKEKAKDEEGSEEA